MEKNEMIEKLQGLVFMLSLNGVIQEDGQALWIAENIKLILAVAQNANHAELLQNHITNFIEEVNLMNETKTVNEFLAKKTMIAN